MNWIKRKERKREKGNEANKWNFLHIYETMKGIASDYEELRAKHCGVM